MPTRRAAVLFATWIVTAQAPAFAQMRGALSWVRAPGADACIGAPELGRRMENIIGRVLVSTAGAEVSVDGHIERAQGRLEVEIRVSDSHGRVTCGRQLQDRVVDCWQLDEQRISHTPTALRVTRSIC